MKEKPSNKWHQYLCRKEETHQNVSNVTTLNVEKKQFEGIK